jgi:methionyl aminopeptidase
MVTIRSEREIDVMREAGRIVGDLLDLLEKEIHAGMTTLELDKLAEDFIRSQKAIPSFKGYRIPNTKPYPASICASINEEVVHGIPSAKRVIHEGDIISVDCGAIYQGYHGDAARTFMIGEVSPEKRKLVEVTAKCLELALEQAVAGNRLGSIGAAVQGYAESFGYGVVRDMVGHGIGTRLHEEPPVPNVGKAGTGHLMREGLVIAIEPMINLGSYRIKTMNDTWTTYTADKKPSAHFEHTVVVRKGKPDVLTLGKAERQVTTGSEVLEKVA